MIGETNSGKFIIGKVTRGKQSHDVFSVVFLLKNPHYEEVADIDYNKIVCVIAV